MSNKSTLDGSASTTICTLCSTCGSTSTGHAMSDCKRQTRFSRWTKRKRCSKYRTRWWPSALRRRFREASPRMVWNRTGRTQNRPGCLWNSRTRKRASSFRSTRSELLRMRLFNCWSLRDSSQRSRSTARSELFRGVVRESMGRSR